MYLSAAACLYLKVIRSEETRDRFGDTNANRETVEPLEQADGEDAESRTRDAMDGRYGAQYVHL
jgi:hypothetical protein